MSEPTPSLIFIDAPGPAKEPLVPPATEALLAAFRAWVGRLATEPSAVPEETDAPAIDLSTLLGQMIALRQEVHLQTRSVRAGQEQQALTQEQLTRALDALQKARENERTQAADERDSLLRPVLKTLVDLHDSLALGQREQTRLQPAILAALESLDQPPSPPPTLVVPFWARCLGLGRAIQRQPDAASAGEHEVESAAIGALERARQLLASLTAGYAMSVQRLERALAQHGVEPMMTLGEAFDPETMEAVEVVHQPGRAGTLVIEEVRRGYRRQGRLFRYAQVKVARE
jgi:molecular chaperone GrpE